MHSGFRAWVTAAFVILIWGITFVNTRALLGECLAQMSLLGGGFIVIGVAIANWRWRR